MLVSSHSSPNSIAFRIQCLRSPLPASHRQQAQLLHILSNQSLLLSLLSLCIHDYLQLLKSSIMCYSYDKHLEGYSESPSTPCSLKWTQIPWIADMINWQPHLALYVIITLTPALTTHPSAHPSSHPLTHPWHHPDRTKQQQAAAVLHLVLCYDNEDVHWTVM